MKEGHPCAPTDRPIPDWKLERLLLGELPADELRALKAQVAADPTRQARLDALQRDNDATLATYHVAPMARAIELKAAAAHAALPHRTRRTGWLVSAGALAVALLLVFALRPPAPNRDRAESPAAKTIAPKTIAPKTIAPETILTKGLTPTLHLYRLTEGVSVRIPDGAEAGPGDLVQAAYLAADAGFGVIISIDGRGAVTQHFAGPLNRAGEVTLDHSSELDDAPGFERFFLVTSAQPIALQTVLDAALALAQDPAAAQTGRLALPQGLRQTTHTLKKRE